MADKRTKRRKGARRVGKTVDSRRLLLRLATTYKLPGLDRSLIFSQWHKIVGRRFAQVSQPERIRGDKLVIRAVDSMWAGDLRQNYETILERIAAVTGEEKIKKLHVVTGPIDNVFLPPEPPPPLVEIEVETADIRSALEKTGLKDHPETMEIMAKVWAGGRRLAKRRQESES